MGRKGIGFCTAVCFLGALLAVMLSVRLGIGDYLEAQAVVETLELRMASMEEQALEKQLKIAKWYNWSLEQGRYVPERNYQNVLNLGEGRMGLLLIPQWKLQLPITHGVGGAAGHDPTTSLPTGSRETQSVLYIEKPMPWHQGMVIQTVLPGVKLDWRVEGIQVMPSGWPPDHPEGCGLLTLVYDNGNTRTLVRCRPGDGKHPDSVAGEDLGSRAFFWGCAPLFTIPALCGAEKMLYFIHPRKRRKGKCFR